MWILIISLIALALVAATAGIIRNRKLQKKIDRGELDAMPEVQEVDAECCGQHEICERDSLLAAVSKQIEYYDDEELDKYIGTAPDAYTPEQEDVPDPIRKSIILLRDAGFSFSKLSLCSIIFISCTESAHIFVCNICCNKE